MDIEEYLAEFKRVEPAPALGERVMKAASARLQESWIDRMWNRRTWLGIAAGFILALGAVWASMAPPASMVETAGHKATKERPRDASVSLWSLMTRTWSDKK